MITSDAESIGHRGRGLTPHQAFHVRRPRPYYKQAPPFLRMAECPLDRMHLTLNKTAPNRSKGFSFRHPAGGSIFNRNHALQQSSAISNIPSGHSTSGWQPHYPATTAAAVRRISVPLRRIRIKDRFFRGSLRGLRIKPESKNHLVKLPHCAPAAGCQGAPL